jgi:hypothetical protein
MDYATEMELLSPQTNQVVRTAGRRYAGIVVQGDRLGAWVTLARSEDPEDRDELRQELEEYLRALIKASEATGVGMPHVPPIGCDGNIRSCRDPRGVPIGWRPGFPDHAARQ